MNLDFNAEPAFSWYVVMLAFSGVLMFVAISVAEKLSERLMYAGLGLGLLGYAVYLAFIFDGGTYTMFYYVFAVPVIALFKLGARLFGRSGESA
ncbi:hypothetical protein [Actinomadura roseirufa]|uniref:hypothetical protein n=1 Tax=Actinomadura roseirufa TaxID=2094049 RepID=UPI0010413294|nr:hypothetical protein [Actinomadura roseirufa]